MTLFQRTIWCLSRIVHAGTIVAGIALHAVLSSPATAAPAPAAAGNSTPLSTAQVEQLVSPIALYPDNLLGQVLMASTYPLEVVEAARWSQENPNLSGSALQDALAMQTWDPAVKALTAAPQTLQMMNDQLQWTQQLGDAFLGQQQDVMNAVQALRQRADAAGNLQTTPQQKVTKTARPRTGGGGAGGGAPVAAQAQVISIEPVSPETIYAPIYNPATVYGAWPYADYTPPFYWYPPGYVAAGAIGFASGFVAGAIWANVDWRRNNVFVNVNRFNTFNRTRINSNVWTHNAAHRGGVPYRDRNVAQRYGGNRNVASREAARNRINANTNTNINRAGSKNANTNRAGSKNANTNRAGSKSANTNRAGNKSATTNRAGNKSANANRASNKTATKANSTARKGTQRSASRADRPTQRPRAAEAGRNRAGGAGGGAGQRMANRPMGGGRAMGGGGGGRRMGGGGRRR